MLLDIFRSNTNDPDASSSQACESKTVIADVDRRAFLSYSQQSGLPSAENWPSDISTVVIPSQRAPAIEYQLPHNTLGSACVKSLPMNGDVVHFSGPAFEGKLVSRMQDVPLLPRKRTSKMTNAEYFNNRSRQYMWTVQGRFKQRMRFDEVVTGQEFGRPFRNTPSSTIVKRGLNMLKHKLPETFECDLFCEEPKFEHPLLAGCQSFRVDRPEDTTDNDEIYGVGQDGNVIEDTSLLNDPTVPQDGVARRKYFSKGGNLERFYFETEFVYTFDFYANFFSPARHRLELTPFFSVDLIPYFNGYPLFMSMAKYKGEYLWATEIWHRRLLNYDERPGGLTKLFSRGGTSCFCDLNSACTDVTMSESVDEKSDESEWENEGGSEVQT